MICSAMNYSETSNRYNFRDEYLDLNLNLSDMVEDFEDLIKNDRMDERQSTEQGR